MSISQRIKLAASFVDSGDIICDIGCDHGYLGIEAIKKGASKIILIDNKEEPLKRAKINTNFLKDEYDIKYLLSDGMDKLEDKVDKIFILGMGGDQISAILENNKEKIDFDTIFILDAHSRIETLRQYLFNNNFQILEEIIVKEKGQFYELIEAQKVSDLLNYNDLDIKFGPILRIKKDPLFIEKWTMKLNKNLKILENNPNLEHIRAEIEQIRRVL